MSPQKRSAARTRNDSPERPAEARGATREPRKETRGATREPRKETRGATREPRKGARDSAREPRKEARGATREPRKETRGATREPRKNARDSAREPRKGARGAAREPRNDAATAKPRSGSIARPRNKVPQRSKEPVGSGTDKAERTAYPPKPFAVSSMSREPHPGMWLFTTRAGSEQDLLDELLLAKVVDPGPRVLGPALVLSPKLPKREGRPMELTFARQGFEIVQSVKSHDLDMVTSRIARSIKNQLAEAPHYALHVWVPDSPEGNMLAALADELDARLEKSLADARPELRRVDDASLRRLTSVKLAQVCVVDTERFVAGVMHANRTPSLARGGRTRVRVKRDAPSRAARKIEEALAWLGVAPGPGEVCVDLGAAPGGWTWVLADSRARVIAVDPARLRPDILRMKGVRHVMESAFTFVPDEHIDWLFCDMAWRPLEAAALLAKWGRKHWARILVANIKLPMTKKAEILARVRKILESEGDWKHVRAKQLYHDRDEITLTALRT